MPATFLKLSVRLTTLAWFATAAQQLSHVLQYPSRTPQIEVLSIENHLLQGLNVILRNGVILVDTSNHSPYPLFEGERIPPLISEGFQRFFIVSRRDLRPASFGLPR